MHPEAGVISEFSKSALAEEVATEDCMPTSGPCVGASTLEKSNKPIEGKLTRRGTRLLADFDEADRLEQVIFERLKGLIRD
jgi:hypothetical protein